VAASTHRTFGFATLFRQLTPFNCFTDWDREMESMSLEQKVRKYAAALPRNTLPIATTSGGIWLVLSLAPSDSGAVYYWDPPTLPSPANRDHFYPVARSFTEFIDFLFERFDSTETEMEALIKNENLEELSRLIESGLDLDLEDEYGRTPLENAVLGNRPDIVEELFKRGAKLRNAIAIAIKNREFFPEFETMVDVLNRLNSKGLVCFIMKGRQ
jgi:hypothetical protein